MLLNIIYKQFQTACEAGYVIFTESTGHRLLDQTLKTNYEVRLAPSLAKKPPREGENEENENKEKKDPFLPCDPTTLISEYKNYNLLFNKFPVIEHHILLTTKNFQSQTDELTLDDFDAVAWFLEATEHKFLMFYNCGQLSGASQPHKHIQGVPMAEDFPFLSLIQQHRGQPSIPALPFTHYLHQFDSPSECTTIDHSETTSNKTTITGDTLYQAYKSMTEQMHKDIKPPYPHELPMLCSNVLLTSDWMMVVPRNDELYEEISVNAVGFVGCLLVMSEDHFQRVRRAGIIRVLQALGYPKSTLQ